MSAFPEHHHNRALFDAKSEEAARESSFVALAEAEDPHWSSCAWTLFWRGELPALSDFGAAAPLEDMIG